MENTALAGSSCLPFCIAAAPGSDPCQGECEPPEASLEPSGVSPYSDELETYIKRRYDEDRVQLDLAIYESLAENEDEREEVPTEAPAVMIDSRSEGAPALIIGSN